MDILRYKFNQHDDIRKALIYTGVSQIIYDDKEDSFWGIGPDGKGKNWLGKKLTKLRNEYLMELKW